MIGIEEKDMIINRIPAKTWNHLHMNQSRVGEVMINRTGELNASVNDVSLIDDGKLNNGELDNIIGGCGQEITEAARKSQTEPVYYITDKKNAVIRLIQIQRVGSETTFINDIGGYCEDGARIELAQLYLSGKNRYEGCEIKLAGDGSSMSAEIGYVAAGKERLDMNYCVRHIGKKTECAINAAGALRDTAFKLFRGTIDFVKGSAGSVGNEKEEVLLIDEKCVNQTIPIILCAEEDVVGNHGATIGKPDEELLFYLESRGIPAQECYNMLAAAKLLAVCGKIPDDGIRNEIHDYIKEVY